MKIPEIITDTEFLKKTGSFRLGVLIAEPVIDETKQYFRTIFDQQANKIAGTYSLDAVNKIENISKTRKAYKSLGVDPNRYRPSADALMRRIVKGMDISSINNVVDVLNYISIRDGFSISGFDREKIQGQMIMGTGKTGEPYIGIGRGMLNISNLPVLYDEIGAIGNPTSDSERTMITLLTRQILFVFYDFGKSDVLPDSLGYCTELLSTYCQAKEIDTELIQFD